MPGNEYGKLRLLTTEYLLRERGSLSTREIQNCIENRYGTRPDRKTVWDDLNAIDRLYPLEQEGKPPHRVAYRMANNCELCNGCTGMLVSVNVTRETECRQSSYRPAKYCPLCGRRTGGNK